MRTKILLVTLVTLLPVAAFAERTISQVITRAQYDANGKYYYFAGAASWGSTSCPNAEYAWFPSTLNGSKELFAIAWSAYLAGKSVQFEGSCYTDPNYITVSYVFIQ